MRRFSLSVCRSLHSHVIQLLRDQLGKRGLQPSDVILRTNLKFLTSAAGLPDVRLFVAEKFEQWVQNSKVCTPFKEYGKVFDRSCTCRNSLFICMCKVHHYNVRQFHFFCKR